MTKATRPAIHRPPAMRSSATAAPATAPMPKRQAPDQCDCTAYCGDDPWLRDGRAHPCPSKVRRDRQYAEAAELFALQRRVADAAARADVTRKGVKLETATGTWLDLRHAPPATADNARYLVLRGLAELDPKYPLFLRLITTPAAPAAPT